MNKYIVLFLSISLFACSRQDKKKSEAIDLPFYNTPDLSPEWINQDDNDYQSIHTIEPFAFVNQNSDTITNSTFENSIYVANFFFTICPGVCPRMNGNLKLVQDEFRKDDRVKILSHSVMPWVDTVAQLTRYAERNEIDNSIWHLVTGPKEDIYKLARESYFADEGFGKKLTTLEDFLHTEKLILIDEKRRIRGIYTGTLQLEVKRMIEDMKTLLTEN
ncbi:MAG: SCO family protein [Cyclobacteriaceae bacterium]